MNSRRKAPMPQCSFHIHKGPSFSGKTTGNVGNVAENMKLSSYLNSDQDTLKEVQPIAPRNISPRSIVENEAPPAITSNTCDNATSFRDISPMRKSITPKTKTAVRRSNSFDDTFCYISSSSSSTDPTKTATISSPIRAGKRKERMLRCSSLPTKIKKNVSFDGKYDKIHEIERITDLPDDVILDLWWSTEDYQNIKREYEAIIYLLDQNMNIDEQHDSARGLHSRTELGAWELYEKQRNARNAVLRQQDIHRKQKIKGTNNTNASADGGMSIDMVIAKAYMDETLHLRDDAIKWAKKDYEIAMDVHVTTSSSDAESLEESISDLSMLINDKEDLAPVAIENPPANDRTIQPIRRTRSDNCFVDSMMINKKEIRQKCAPSRSKSKEQSQSKLSDHIYNTSDSVLFQRTEQLASVFEESVLIMSDDDDEEDDEEGDGKTQSDDDARSTETIPKQTHQKDHVATRVRFASKTQKIKRIKVKDIETDTKKRWYSKAELIEIASDVNNMVETIEKEGQCLDSEFVPEKCNGETRRGLEKSTEIGAKKLYDRRRHAWNVVLATQSKHRQNQNNNQDVEYIDAGPMSIAEAYIAATKEAQQEAMKFGKQDAKEARKYRIKRRSTTPDPNSKDRVSADHTGRSTGGRRSQTSSKDDEEEEKSSISDIKERSISPPFERHVASGDDSIHSLLNTHTDSTDDSYDYSSRSILNLDSTDDCNDFSVRSILNLDTDSVLSADSVSTSEANCADLIDGICSAEHRLSESHAPNRRFVQAATASLNRHIKMLEAKQQSSTIFGPLRDGKSIVTKSKKFHNNPYDTSSTRDDSTTNDGSEGNDTTDSIREESLKTRLAPVQEALKMDVLSSTSKSAPLQEVLNGALLSSAGNMSQSESNSDSFVWFQVKAADIKEMLSEDGSVVYVLRNAIKCDSRPLRS